MRSFLKLSYMIILELINVAMKTDYLIKNAEFFF